MLPRSVEGFQGASNLGKMVPYEDKVSISRQIQIQFDGKNVASFFFVFSGVLLY